MLDYLWLFLTILASDLTAQYVYDRIKKKRKRKPKISIPLRRVK